MAFDLVYGGRPIPGRGGTLNLYGTFWSAVKPGTQFGTELLTDGAMEKWTNSVTPTNWSIFIGSVSQTIGVPRNGTACMGLLFSGIRAIVTQNVTLLPNTYYKLEGYAAQASGGYAGIHILDTGNSLHWTEGGTWASAGTLVIQFSDSNYKQFQYIFKTGTNTGYRIRIGGGTASTGTFWRFDDLTLTQVGVTNTLGTEIAHRLMENAGRAKGLSGIGTLEIDGTNFESFGTNFFKYTPLVDVYILANNLRRFERQNNEVHQNDVVVDLPYECEQAFEADGGFITQFFQPNIMPEKVVRNISGTGFTFNVHWGFTLSGSNFERKK